MEANFFKVRLGENAADERILSQIEKAVIVDSNAFIDHYDLYKEQLIPPFGDYPDVIFMVDCKTDCEVLEESQNVILTWKVVR